MTKVETFKVGYWVALTLAQDAAPIRSYVGSIQAVDGHGVRITMIDWLTGGDSSWDFFAPWSVITSALVCTPEHTLDDFGKAASAWQERMSLVDLRARVK